MMIWEANIEYVPKVVWNRLILPDDKVISINQAETEKNWRKTHNGQQGTILRRYMGQHKIQDKLDRMVERKQITKEQVA
jgi:hypothetical protein